MPKVGVFAAIFDEIQQINFFDKNALPSQIHPWNIIRINDAYDNKLSYLWVFE